MTTIKNTTKKLQKEFGKAIGSKGADYEVVDRIPTDWFQFDLSSGGGFPRGMVSTVYGPEGCGKTTLSYKLIAQHQRRWPKLYCSVIDVEHVYAPDWAKIMGVNTEEVYVFKPDFVEQAGDVIETLLYSDDCGLIVLDSLAALETSKAIDEPMDKVQVAGASVMIKRMCNKVTAALRAAAKEGRQPPTVLYINQIRSKIGVLFGNPETMPGGMTPKFQSSFTVRMWGKPIKDEKISKALPARREMQTDIKKARVKTCSANAKWEMNLIANGGYGVGECDDWTTIKAYLEHFGLWTTTKINTKVQVVINDGEVREFPTQGHLRQELVDNGAFMDAIRTNIISRVMDGEVTS